MGSDEDNSRRLLDLALECSGRTYAFPECFLQAFIVDGSQTYSHLVLLVLPVLLKSKMTGVS